MRRAWVEQTKLRRRIAKVAINVERCPAIMSVGLMDLVLSQNSDAVAQMLAGRSE